ncbi:hypothetical protein [Piscinibacter gummiphilus]|uniref:Uncharacterized protein n=1 Tax=Piscinibacter gummiphilus TaxID=946333 RepID=A0ABZ0CPF4_9BURK|nr:hypothetical protein [Piscinibacter gummiphilus]WOB06871.1 hypothetical protein RXV79_18335 [Piscinibacter gummiphilus]
MISRFTQLFRTVMAWGWPAKFLIGAAISAFAGGSVLGFLLQNAAYYFALAHGFRPPVEGIPYLVAMVTFGSISLMILAAMLAAASIVVMRDIGLKAIEWIDSFGRKVRPGRSIVERFRALSATAILLIALSFSAATAVADEWLRPMLAPYQLCAWPILLCPSHDGLSLFLRLQSFAIGVIVVFMVWRPSLVWLGTALLVASQYVWIAASVLPIEGYARLLRLTGFGGGIHVSAEIQAEEAPPRTIDGYLLMRSTSHIFLYLPNSEEIAEYPLAAVVQLRNRSGGLNALPFRLPREAQLRQK